MKKVGIIADSTCDLPIEIIQQYDIGIVPVNVIFNDEEVRQQYINLTTDEFYSRLIAGERVTSGVPSPKVFKDVIDKQLEKYDEIIFLTLSSKLSAVYQTANLVIKQFNYDNVFVVDTLSGTIETGLVVLIAAREIAKGKSSKDIINFLESAIIPNVHLISYAATLKYLRRGGRISRLKHLMGTVLNIKPIFHIEKGEIVSPGRVMLWQNIDNTFKKLLTKMAGKQIYDTVFIAHSGNPDKCKELINYFKTLPDAPKEILMAEVGPAVGVHVGPDTFGFIWVGEYSDEWFKDL
ncbi:MAG: DegV family protein [Candidatus Heimdallarchaeota archaeon]|nr:DegV family protein [Candidatus Heimdallarchaeota archaeon]